MADHHTTAPQSLEEAYKVLSIIPNPDGSFTRPSSFPNVPPNPDPLPTDPPTTHFLSRDISLNPAAGTFLRLFRPLSPPSSTKLPIIIYFHGGGFVRFSAATVIFHECCGQMAAHVPALVASVDYRLAPEHRLPAAYDDAMDAIAWVKTQAIESTESDPWVREFGDFSRVHLMGSSAGGNMAYHAAVHCLDLDLSPVKIAGIILHQPFFGGVERSESEFRLADNKVIPLNRADCYWYVTLPEGADRDHEYCNMALAAAAEAQKEKIRRLPRCLVKGCSGDLLVDRQKEAAKLLVENGVDVVAVFSEGGYHAVEIFDQNMARVLYDDVRDFVNFSTNMTYKVNDNLQVYQPKI